MSHQIGPELPDPVSGTVVQVQQTALVMPLDRGNWVEDPTNWSRVIVAIA